MTGIVQLHEELLTLLLKVRETDKGFKFHVRERNAPKSKIKRLESGYWFQGAEHYIWFSPFKRGDWKNKTKTLGLSLGQHEGAFSWGSIELAFQSEDKPNRLKMYSEISDALDNLPELTKKDKRQGEISFSFPNEMNTLDKIVAFYLQKALPIMNQKIIEFGEEDAFFITDLKFNKQIQKTLRLRDRLRDLIKIEYPASFPTHGQLQTNFRNEFNIPKQVNKVDLEYDGIVYSGLSLGEEGNGNGRIYFNQRREEFGSNHPELTGGEKITVKVTFDVPEFIENNENDQDEKEEELKQFRLNQILYGPPGTGKTYNTVKIAAEIINPSFNVDEENEEESYEHARQIYLNALGDQIEFVTFHQNFSYEDFIQGIRPKIEGSTDSLAFEKVDGVFKQIADRALQNLIDSSKTVEELSKKETFNTAFRSLTELWQNNEEDVIPIKMKSGQEFNIYDITNSSIKFSKPKGKSVHTLSRDTLKQMFDDGENNIIKGGLAVYYEPLLKELLSLAKEASVEKVPLKNYVIVIDEINRANISRVFGELITLIEEDKRTGAKYPMKVKLPSGDEFEVPKNLHIIGTMNTADKSIALLDVALRRRFKFIPKYPDATLENVMYPEEMGRINKEILATGKGRDFLIGHSYFMNDRSEISEIMNEEVIPLLMEYFMNNESQVKSILKNAGLKVKAQDFPIEVENSLVDESV